MVRKKVDMTVLFNAEGVAEPRIGAPVPRKPYHRPTLIVYGQVGQLTQGASNCGANDGNGCTVGPSTMGPKT
jgi:hypothetical protein